MFAGRDVAVHHAPPVHPRHRPGQPHRQPDQLVDRQRLRQPGQARAADVRQHDRPRDTAAPPPAARPPSTPRSRSRIATSCRSRRCASGPSGSLRMTVPPGKEQPSHPRAFALVHQLGPNGRISTRQHPAPSDTSIHRRTPQVRSGAARRRSASANTPACPNHKTDVPPCARLCKIGGARRAGLFCRRIAGIAIAGHPLDVRGSIRKTCRHRRTRVRRGSAGTSTFSLKRWCHPAGRYAGLRPGSQ